MPYYPVFFDISKTPCVVIGGGCVAERKILNLVSAGALVTVISPRVTDTIKKLVEKGSVRYIPRVYRKGDLKGFFLVISASNSKKTNTAVSSEAGKTGVLVNIVDLPELCDFIVPSLITRGSLQIAISSSGQSPMLSKTIRKTIESVIGREYETLLEILGRIRKKLLKEGLGYDRKYKIYERLINPLLLDHIRHGNRVKIDSFLKEIAGEGVTLASLGVRLKK
ncbi:MAG: bifunctional precorrin-2 dehydrogenase/sirohydrochlorin ferrochelatase [Deltaproteobacteria bacterium]|nr:bifunctional precorrin-2 dehydrogenase/sirohydrochlorin ferrochelatase [Deltaproteobacteria bacterium]